jgi:hypothetical protein
VRLDEYCAVVCLTISSVLDRSTGTGPGHRRPELTANATRQREGNIVNDVNYVAVMNLARVAWDENNLARTRELLERYFPKPGAPDLRGFEWHYLRRLLHGDPQPPRNASHRG